MKNRLTAILILLIGFFSWTTMPVFAALEAVPIPRLPYGSSGSHQIDLFSGSANYAYPIKVPKGVNDLTPDVSLSYNNAGAYGFSSLAGSGWQVNRDYVERDVNYSPKNESTSDDKFKLHFKGATYDLVYVSADSRYHTKIESNLNIKKLSGGSNQNSEYWQVITPDGTKYRFGYASQSEQMCNEHNYIANWHLDRVEDTHGNTITYTYTEDGSSWSSSLTKIEYNNAATHKIEFNYTSIPYQRYQYKQGCDISEPNRFSTITVKTNNTLVRQYDFSFTQAENAQNLLATITEKGSDGSPLPATTFTYKPEVKSWNSTKETWINNANIDAHLERPDVEIADVNGDGFVDIVRTSHGGGPNVTWKVLFNQAGAGWPTTYQTLINNVAMEDAELNRPEVRLMDVTGDNLPDIVMAASAANWNVWRNTGGNWNTSHELWGNLSGHSDATLDDANVRLIDMTGDGLPDVVRTWWNGAMQWEVYRNTGSGWSGAPEVWSHGGSGGFYHGLTDSDTMLLDVNGDGLPDIVHTTYSGNNDNSTDTWRVYRNTGSSFRTSYETWINNSNITAHLGMESIGFADVNGDGLPDIVKAYDYGGADELKVLTNQGNSWSTTWTTWVPTSANMDVDFNGESNVRIADVTGDGMADIVRTLYSGVNATWDVYKNNGSSPKMLQTVKSPEGALTSFTYQPSTKYQNNGTDTVQDLPIPMWLISQKAVSNGMASASGQLTNDVTSYSYANGMYDWQDKEFRGFGNVFETTPNGTKNTHVFHQDDALQGKLDRTETLDGSNNFYTTQKNTWSNNTANGVTTVNLADEQDYTYDGASASAKVRKVEYQYDSYGNVTKASELGDTSVSGDERFTYTEYTANTSAWLVNTPKHTYKHAANDSTKVAESWFYYDENIGLNDTPIKGDVTKEVKWLDGGTNPVTQYAYDSYGNQTQVTDANNHVTQAGYDSTGTYQTSTTNAKNQTSTKTYDLGTGNVLTETDPNGLTTTYTYDVFGRLTKEIKPYDSAEYPTTSYSYAIDGIAPEGVTVSKRKISSQSAVLAVQTWTDGLQRQVQLRADAEESGQQIVTDTFYDPIGEVAKQTVPYLAAASVSAASPAAGIRFTGYTYDPMGRVTILTTPDNKTKTTTYDHWKATDIDENGHIKRTYLNAHEKITKIEEVNGIDTYTTTYEYNANDQLTKIIDEADNENILSYDTLGRRISQNDPDMGTWEYEYDAVGNVTKQTDNRDVAVTKTYDVLNRLTKTDYPTDTDVTYAYDLDKIGTLSIATDSAGMVSYTYDNRLRKTQEQRSVNGTTKTTGFTYDAADRMSTMTYPDGEVVTYAHNNQGEIESVTGTTGILDNVDYNAQGKITKKDFANGATTNYTYNTNDFRLNRIQTGSLQDLNYTYDNVGNISSISDNLTSKIQSFSYDDLDRLKTASESANGYSYAYEYNAIGNLTKFTNAGIETDYTYGAGNAGPHALTSSTGASSSAQPTTTTFHATDDVYVVSAEVNNNFNSDTDLGTDATYGISSYMKYDLTALAGKTVTDAKLRIYVTQASSGTHNIKMATSSAWTETSLTYNNRPALNSTVVGSINNATTTNTWHEIDLTSSVNSNVGQLYTIGMDTASGDDLWFNGEDAANNKVELVVTYTGTGGSTPTPTPTVTPTGTPTPTPTPSFSEDWSSGTINSSNWTNWGGSQVTVASNELKITSTTAANYYGVDKATSVDLTGGSIVNQLTSAGNQSLTSWEAYPIYIEKAGDPTNGVYLYVTGNKIWIQKRISGVDTFLDKGSYSSTNHQYFRMRESGGTLFIDTSANGTSWTNLDSFTNPFAMTSVKIGIAGGTFQTEGSTTFATFDNFTFTTAGSSGTPAASSLIEAWTTIDTGKWSDWGGAQTGISSNQLQISSTTGANYYGIESIASYNLVGSQVTSELVSAGNQSLSSWEAYPLYVGTDSSLDNAVFIYVTQNHIWVQKKVSGVDTLYDAGSYNSTNHKYFRIREASGTMYFDASADGSTWNNFHSFANPFTLTSVKIGFAGGTFQTEGSTTSALFDNLNILPSGGGSTPTPTSGTATPTPTQSANKTYVYDDNGNMTSDGEKCYEYNEANQMDKVTNCNSQTIAEYVYDYTGLRMVKKNFSSGTLANTVTSWSDAYETKVIVAGATENISYYFANKQLIAKKDKDGNKTYIHADHLGSTNVVTNQAGGLVEATKYDPWGQVKSGGTANKFLYTGQEKDGETGLMYYNARYYSPEIRRFIQPDPLIQDVYSPQSLNRYSYVMNNPLRYTDPTGQVVTCNASGCSSSYTVLNKPKPQPKPATVSQFVAAAKPQPAQQKQQTPNNNNNPGGIGSQNKPSVDMPKNVPPKVSVRSNMQVASQHKYNVLWFIDKVNNGQDWDYKNPKKYGKDAHKYADFGNFNYGATGYAAGYPEYILLNAGGAKQIEDNGKREKNGETLAPSEGIPGLTYPYGDDSTDSYWIRQGYKYAEELNQ